MLLLRRQAYARVGLVGNPSDGYGGKTLSLIVKNFRAEVVLYEWEEVEIVWTDLDQSRFRSVHDLVRDVKLHGYYGGLRLVKATIKKFVEYCQKLGHPLHARNFSVRYHTDIPRQVGLAGSSAIIVATLRCLMDFYGVRIPLEVQPSLVLAVEMEELGITAGLQDRVIQVYEGLVYMDFSHLETHQPTGYSLGKYEPLDPTLLPPIYIAFSIKESEPTERYHNDLRGRYQRGDSDVVNAMTRFAALAQEARAALLAHDADTLARTINDNFDLRRSITRLPPGQEEMVEKARSVGASAKFAGSGGAIVGTYRDQAMFARLQEVLGTIDCQVIKPVVG
jgi:glucuronokinase